MRVVLKFIFIALSLLILFTIIYFLSFFILRTFVRLLPIEARDLAVTLASLVSLVLAVSVPWLLATRRWFRMFGPQPTTTPVKHLPQEVESHVSEIDFQIFDVFTQLRSIVPVIFVPFFGLMLIPSCLVLAFGYGLHPNFLSERLADQPSDIGVLVWDGLRILVLLLDLGLSYWFTAALVLAVVATMADRPLPTIRALSITTRRLVPVVFGALLFWSAIGVAAFVLIVPAFAVATAYYVAIPAIVVERVGPMNGFRRSAALVKNCRYKVLGIVVTVSIIALTVNLAVIGIARLMSVFEGESVGLALWIDIFVIPRGASDGYVAFFYAISALIEGATQVAFVALYTVTYMQLRAGNEGRSAANICDDADLGAFHRPPVTQPPST